MVKKQIDHTIEEEVDTEEEEEARTEVVTTRITTRTISIQTPCNNSEIQTSSNNMAITNKWVTINNRWAFHNLPLDSNQFLLKINSRTIKCFRIKWLSNNQFSKCNSSNNNTTSNHSKFSCKCLRTLTSLNSTSFRVKREEPL